jgi:hypothetical protein
MANSVVDAQLLDRDLVQKCTAKDQRDDGCRQFCEQLNFLNNPRQRFIAQVAQGVIKAAVY